MFQEGTKVIVSKNLCTGSVVLPVWLMFKTLFISYFIRRTGVLVFGPRGCDELENIKRSLSVNGVPYQVFPGNEVGTCASKLFSCVSV